jgi:hypothetical protein
VSGNLWQAFKVRNAWWVLDPHKDYTDWWIPLGFLYFFAGEALVFWIAPPGIKRKVLMVIWLIATVPLAIWIGRVAYKLGIIRDRDLRTGR